MLDFMGFFLREVFPNYKYVHESKPIIIIILLFIRIRFIMYFEMLVVKV